MAPLVPAKDPSASDLTSSTKRSGVVEPAPPAPTWTLAVVAVPATWKLMFPAVVLNEEAARPCITNPSAEAVSISVEAPEKTRPVEPMVLLVRVCVESILTAFVPSTTRTTPPVWSVTVNSSEDDEAGPNSKVDKLPTEGDPSDSRTVEIPPPAPQ